jgi:hypothetical protein
MKFPDTIPQRLARAADIRHARKLESICRRAFSRSLAREVYLAFNRAEGHAGTSRANDMLRRRESRWFDLATRP